MSNTPILQIALPTPLDKLFDYLAPIDWQITEQHIGSRIQVPFRKQVLIGILIGVTDTSSVAPNKLKTALTLLDEPPLLTATDLQLLHWASRYYHHPLGLVIATALPALLNAGHPPHVETPPSGHWCVTQTGQFIDPTDLPRQSHRQAYLLSLFQENPRGISETTLALDLPNPRPTLQALQRRGWITPQPAIRHAQPITTPLQLNTAQAHAVEQLTQHLSQFYPSLLDGVTGSGKTEVYLQLIQTIITQGKQALVLVPEINLTPQMVSRFEQRFSVPIAVIHSRLNHKERLYAWLLARAGTAPIVIGTRSAVWTPLPQLGIIIIDEEHDPSYKQQDGFCYSARDIAMIRAQRAKIPIILGSATPSLDSLYNIQQQRYQHLILPERAGLAVHPTFHLVDMRHQPRKQILSRPLQHYINQHLAKKQQILLFINRRGYAPTLICLQCKWTAHCQHCDARLTHHEASHYLRCHHCGFVQPTPIICPNCHSNNIHLLGQGTERVEEQLQQIFPDARILRIDSDSTRRKQAMFDMLEQIHRGEVDILVGTQMLAKGHHFPKVTLVGIINIDGGLFSVDFRGTERMAQLFMQVAGRAGRAEDAGEVVIQTYQPEHELLNCLINKGYHAFADIVLAERQQTNYPPYTRLILLRAESKTAKLALDFLRSVKEVARQLNIAEVELWGPAPAPMEKRANYYRAHLLLQAQQRNVLHHLIEQLLPILPSLVKKDVRWTVDVDPLDLY
ncbi:primosomal protein N' [Beggiatoa leptomitoformis]|uniref:Replication restart protein PriA n=1 Tax=Beggiatoa leptomitoformis TaxID=288004 RepID=A0A2N9YHY9_9GAMM|nr:primosomal protein N' [Beggiatoa leptomitoformis]ALG67626.1 primosomal protein N' [Beggiatoa leptomitoformis]AUI70142.1 primosomal protein N' [Beggiatoa leptomitoformis]